MNVTPSPDTDMNQTGNWSWPDYDDFNELRWHYHIISGMLNTVMISVAVICNITSLVVYTRRAMTSATSAHFNLYLIAVAIYDTFYVLEVAVIWGLPATDTYHSNLEQYMSKVFLYLFRILVPLNVIVFAATAWIMVALVLDRYIALCHPRRAHRWCTIRTARIIILTLSLIAALSSIPSFFEIGVKRVTTITGYILTWYRTELFFNPTYIGVYKIAVLLLLVQWGPLVAMLVLSALLCYKLFTMRRASAQARAAGIITNETSAEEISVTKVSMWMVAAFLACYLLAVVAYTNDIAFMLMRPRPLRISFIFYCIINLITVLKSTANFTIYVAVNANFRVTLLEVVCRGCVWCPWRGSHPQDTVHPPPVSYRPGSLYDTDHLRIVDDHQ